MGSKLSILALILAVSAGAEGLLPPLTESQVQQARKILAGFKANPKGPYLQIRWFCNDGSVHPPSPPPCASRGGGFQHAELSPAARRLSEWNIDADTILTGLSFEQFFDAARDHHRLKELVLAKYLGDVDQGWIYRRAQYYRGARQVEDEEKAGRRLLAQLLSDSNWVGKNYFLALQVTAAVPHGAADRTVAKIRTLAKSIADRDSRFQAIRSKIHSTPGPEDLKAVEDFLATRNPAEPVKAPLVELVALLKDQRAGRTLQAQLPALQKAIGASQPGSALSALGSALQAKDDGQVFSRGAELAFAIRRTVSSSSEGRRNLQLLDLAALVLENGFQLAEKRSVENPSRRRLLAGLLDNYRYAVGAGLLSMRQLEALQSEIASLQQTGEIRSEQYYQSVRYLARSTEWCRATVAKDFEPLVRQFESVEPAAAGLVDDLVRGSPALPLSHRMNVLVSDANRAQGIRHSILGESSSQGIVGLNPGVAVGRLGIVNPGEETAAIDPEGIYVIPETLADLKPMAGILTLDSGNALSHAQLLAANLGIPNATVPSVLLPALRKYQGQEMFFAVTPRRVVVLEQKAKLSDALRKIWGDQPVASKARLDLDTTRVELSETRVLSLADLSAKDSGVKVGPKAANLAQLSHFFPANVVPGLVIPFGIYFEHVNRVLDRSGAPLQQQITQSFAEAERMRAAGASPAEVSRFIYPRLAHFREVIQGMAFLPAFEKELLARMKGAFGTEGSYGVFVRSDTNAEDLPEFTGAGLNLTVPNQVGARDILRSIKDVWASPFTERAYDWRSKILRSSERVFPSVVLLLTVPSDKSGVIGTMNLETGDTNDITVNISEGISAVVDGGVAESLLLKPNGEVRLLEQARSPYKKVVLPTGGLANRPASGDDYVLARDEIRQLRQMVDEVKKKYTPARNEAGQPLPWDIELGFVRGELRLFQIRPLVRYQQVQTLEALGKLDSGGPPSSSVRLDDPPL